MYGVAPIGGQAGVKGILCRLVKWMKTYYNFTILITLSTFYELLSLGSGKTHNDRNWVSSSESF